MSGTTKGSDFEESASALDAQLAGSRPDALLEDWREKVAIAREAREFGARLQRASAKEVNHSAFPPR